VYKFKNSLMALIGVITLIVVTTVLVPHIGYGSSGNTAPTPSTQNVKVVNTTSEAVPIQGTVQAAQNGTWNVGINGTPAVGLDQGNNTVKFDAVNNTVKIDAAAPVLMRDIDNPARNALRLIAGGSFIDQGSSSGAFSTAQFQDFTVPNGKRFIIENVSISGLVNSDQTVICELHETPDAVGFPLIFISLSQVRPNIWQTTQLVRLYVEPQHQIEWMCSRTGGGIFQSAYKLVVNGYLVSVP